MSGAVNAVRPLPLSQQIGQDVTRAAVTAAGVGALASAKVLNHGGMRAVGAASVASGVHALANRDRTQFSRLAAASQIIGGAGLLFGGGGGMRGVTSATLAAGGSLMQLSHQHLKQDHPFFHRVVKGTVIGATVGTILTHATRPQELVTGVAVGAVIGGAIGLAVATAKAPGDRTQANQ